MTTQWRPLMLLVSVFTLMGLGWVMAYSGSAFVLSDGFFFAKRHGVHLVLGALCMVVAVGLHPRMYRRFAYLLYGLAMLVLVLVLIPGVGRRVGGSARWLDLGFLRVQGGEILKIALVFYLAMSLAKKGDKMRLFHAGIIPHIVIPGLAVGLLLAEPDFGTAFVAVSVTFIMLFIGGARTSYLLAMALVALPLALHAVTSSTYRLRRLIAFLDPWSHRQDSGYQVVESLIAMGSGQLSGTGVGQGPAKLHFLPAAHTDFVLSLIGQEWGFFGVSVVLLCFVSITVVGLRAAISQTDLFCRYLAVGITTTLVLQAVVNTFVALGIVPTKGITLPFVSYGGASLLISCFMAGILLQLSTTCPEDCS
ncbi:MAG: putative lipid II flippase FtsW [Myxococcota bacterium]